MLQSQSEAPRQAGTGEREDYLVGCHRGKCSQEGSTHPSMGAGWWQLGPLQHKWLRLKA